MGVSAAVLGASGYAGGEVLRLLAGHPAITVVAVAAGAREGTKVAGALPHLGALDLELTSVREAGAAGEVCFSCLPHGTLPQHLDALAADLIVDLGDDYRGAPEWLYGLPELDRSHHRDSTRIANPGCYPTATLLCLVPFARAGLIATPVIVDALSGFSGAGRSPQDHLLFANAAGDAKAYGTVAHRHVPEVERGLARFAGADVIVSFTPHLVPMARGLMVTARAPLAASLSDDDAVGILEESYAHEPFVTVTREWPSTKLVAGTNRALVSARVDERAGFLVASAAIDNLGKGAAGQAIQNANLALGLEETAGLEGTAVWP